MRAKGDISTYKHKEHRWEIRLPSNCKARGSYCPTYRMSGSACVLKSAVCFPNKISRCSLRSLTMPVTVRKLLYWDTFGQIRMLQLSFCSRWDLASYMLHITACSLWPNFCFTHVMTWHQYRSCATFSSFSIILTACFLEFCFAFHVICDIQD